MRSAGGLLTSPLRALPDFLIIGTQRGGTSALYRYLSLHPQILPASRKEIHYLDRWFGRGDLWYRSHFPTRRRLAGRAALTGEATPNYLFYPPAAQRARQLVPEARLIVLLRDPVDRAHSAWRLMVAGGYESLSFEEAIRREPERIGSADGSDQPSPALFRYSYVSRGHYAEQLERWFGFFPRESFLVLSSEDLFQRPDLVCHQVLEFLGLPAQADIVLDRTYSAEGPPIAPDLAARLREHFREPNLRLYELVGRDFGWDPER